MFTKTLLAAAVLTTVATITTAPAHACINCGVKLNGVSFNGISLQGRTFNGLQFNGVQFNGAKRNVGGEQSVGLNGKVIAIEF